MTTLSIKVFVEDALVSKTLLLRTKILITFELCKFFVVFFELIVFFIEKI